MDDAMLKADLRGYLQQAREAVVWKLDGASEYEIRRPMTTTGTNLLGLVKHVAGVELGYFTEVFDRPSEIATPWLDAGAETNADFFAASDESREWVLQFYRDTWAVSDATIEALDLDSPGEVAWWPPARRQVTLGRILVHVIAETNRHAGQADIVREEIDGAVGHRADNSNMAEVDDEWWSDYRGRLEALARSYKVS